MTTAATTEVLLRELAPQVLAAIVRRYRDFADAEDAVQEAVLAAATTWPTDGEPDNPLGWLIHVASRRMADQYRRDDARRRREDRAASWSLARPEPASGHDDTLILMFMCCNPSITPVSAIPLTLRAVGGLTTREIATSFLVPEATMAQRISRAKAKVKASDEPFTLPSPDKRAERLRSVLHVLYLLDSVRAHLLELSGDTKGAIVEFRAAAARTTNLREQHYLTTKAARLATGRAEEAQLGR